MQLLPVKINYYRNNKCFFELFRMPSDGQFFSWQKDFCGNLLGKLSIKDTDEETANLNFKQFIFDKTGEVVEIVNENDFNKLVADIESGQYQLL